MAVFELSQRDVEGLMEDLDTVYRRIEDCEDSDTLRDYARQLRDMAGRAACLARDYEDMADEADAKDEAEDEDCAHCGHGLESDTHKNFCFWQ